MSAAADAGEVVREEPGLRAYRTEIPNLVIDDERLGPYERALYLHYKRIAGDRGECWQGRAQLEKATGIGHSKLVEARAKLVECGYLKVEEQVPRPTVVTIVNIWAENFDRYRPVRVTKATDRSADNTVRQADDIVRHTAQKKIPIRRSLEEVRSGAGAELSLIGTLGQKLEAIGMEPDRVDQLFELFEAKGYTDGRDLEWVVEQGVDRNAKSLAYYREILASNPPGIAERQLAARRSRRRAAGVAPPAPRGATHDGMPKAPPLRTPEVSL